MSAVLEKKSPAINRAYSILEIKAVHEDERIIEGIATTISPDRMGDVVETDGIEFKLPMPLLNQHNSREPVGNVIKAEVRKGEIWIRAKFAAPGLLDYVDRAWAQVKAGLVRGLSIGFRSLEESWDNELGGFHFLRSEWMELSVVTIPANADASILSVKTAALGEAASGRKFDRVVRLSLTPNLPGVSGQPKKDPNVKTKISDQIAQFEAKRAANEARMDEIMSKSAETQETLDSAAAEEYDGLEGENKSIDEHLVRLRAAEKRNAEKAVPVVENKGFRPTDAQRPQISVKANIEPGTGFTRLIMAKAAAKVNGFSPLEVVRSRKHWMDQTPEVELALKAIVEAGDTTTSAWASQLVPASQQLQDEFLAVLRPQTLLGRIPGLLEVPFNVRVPIGTAGMTHSWVGQAAAAPVGSMTFSNAELVFAKTTGITAITKELALLSSPKAEAIIRNELIRGTRAFLDAQFVGSADAVAGVSPAGILNGISSTAVSGTDQDAFRVDLNTLLGKFATNNQEVQNLALLMSTNMLLTISLMQNALGQSTYPGLSLQPMANGSNGTIANIPVYASNAVSGAIIAIQAGDILFASGDGITVDVSTEASVEMDSAPAMGEQSPPSTQSVIKSFWQNGLIGLKVERQVTWKVGRTSAVEYLVSPAYTTAP